MKRLRFGALRHLMLSALGLAALPLFAQQITVTGTVSDPQGEPLIGVTVASQAGQGTATDLDGNYTIQAQANGQLTFSYIGYETVQAPVNNQNTINIVMHEQASALDELVVVGYGTMKKNDLTGAVSSLGGKDIKDVPVNNIGSAMQGRLAGVQIIDAQKPGDNVSIKVRGLGSIRECSPLVVIDGVPTDLALNALNPQDIERMDVLKDASATAIYGSRGANGVVLITTRKGSSERPRVTVSANCAVQSVAKTMDLLDAAGYAALSNDMMAQAGNPSNPLWVDPSELGKGTQWVNELLQTGVMQNYNVSYSGGTEKSHYYMSGGFLDQSGIVKGVGYRRFTLQSNNDAQVTRWLKFSNNLLFSADRKRSGSYSMMDAMRALPVFPVKEANGEWSGPSGNSEWYGSIRNPVGSNEVYKSTTNGYNLLANITADIRFCDWLSFRSVFGYDAKFWYNDSFSPAYDWKPTPVEESSQYQSSNKSFTYLSDNYFTFDKTFAEKHWLNVMLGTSTQWNEFDWMSGQMNGFLFDKYHQLNNGIEMYDISGSKSSWALVSLMARANYSYADRYMITATVRRDGSSRFGRQHRWGTFPSVSAAWRISKEAFWPEDKAMNDLKLRLGYGQTGNQASIGQYGYLSTMATIVYPLGTVGKDQAALVSQTLANPQLHWEAVEQFNGGVDLAFFKNRLVISLDGYIKNTRDMLVKATIPITSGFEDTFDSYTNAGKVRNIGWELSANSVNFDGAFKWETGLVVTYNKNRIISLNTDTPMYQNEFSHSYITMLANHYPINVFYGYVTDGIFQNREEIAAHAIQVGAEPGDIRFRDLNNDGVINDKDRTIIGNPNPTWLFSLNNTFSYKGFDLGIYFQGVGGNKIFNATRAQMESMSAAYNQFSSTLERWQGEGTSNSMPRAVYGDPNNNNRISDRWVEDGSYLRLKTLSLSYNFPNKWFRTIGVKDARLTFSAENLFTITKYSGFDPEVGENGLDWSSFPSCRTFNFGLSFNF